LQYKALLKNMSPQGVDICDPRNFIWTTLFYRFSMSNIVPFDAAVPYIALIRDIVRGN